MKNLIVNNMWAVGMHHVFIAIQIYINDELLRTTDTQKLLGVIIDKNLIWDSQIDMVCLNITRRITLMKQLSKYINKDSLKV